jgi:hypothetical protein
MDDSNNGIKFPNLSVAPANNNGNNNNYNNSNKNNRKKRTIPRQANAGIVP